MADYKGHRTVVRRWNALSGMQRRVSGWVFFVFVGLICLSNVGFCEWGRTADDFIALPFWRGSEICSDGNGGCWAVGSVGRGIGAVHLDRDGDTTWGQDIVMAFPHWESAWLWLSKPVTADNGDLIVATHVQMDTDLEEPEGVSDSLRIYLQRINLNQDLLWGEEGIALDTSHFTQSIKGIFKGPVDETYLIHWSRWNEPQHASEPRLQLINGEGEFLWGANGIDLADGWINSKIVMSSDQCVIVAQNVAPTPAIEIIKLDSNGDRLWRSNFPVLWDTLTERNIVDIESDKAEGAILVYEYDREDTVNNNINTFRGINIMRISGEGDSLWTIHLYERHSDDNRRFPTIYPIINYAGSGCFFAAWVDFPNSFKVIAFNDRGELVWDESVDVITSGTGHSHLYAVDSDDGVCYAWINREDTEQEHRYIYQQWGQRISLEGERLWGNSGRCIQATNETRSSIITDCAGGAITLIDFGNYGTVQMINRNGEIGLALPTGVDADKENQNPYSPAPQLINIYPNPGNSHFRIQLDPSISNEIFKYRIFNMLGKSVADGLMPGTPYVIEDMSRFSSGEYLLRLQSTKLTVSTRFSLIK